MSSLGRLVAGIAHELNNPINFVYGNVDFLGQYMEDLLKLVAIVDNAQLPEPLRMHEIHARRGDGEELTLIVTSTPLGDGLTLETYRDVTAESRVQRKYHALLARERGAKEELERKVSERTEALKRAQDQLVLNEKMSSLGRLVAGIAHELNNPINFVYGNVDFLAQYFRHLISLLKVYEGVELPDDVRARAEELKKSIDFEFLLDDWERLLKSVRAGAERTAQISRLNSAWHGVPDSASDATSRGRRPVYASYAGLR